MINELIKFRKYLHSKPELSGSELQTAEAVKDYMNRFAPDEVIENIGGAGIAFSFKGTQPGKTLLFRAELDALPIEEENKFDYKSKFANISHKCGHDGHMAILCGLAGMLRAEEIFPGKVILLFQPEEETGSGAEKILKDKKYSGLNPDMVFALHNVPGFPLNSVLIKEDVITVASVGMIVKLKGKTVHAAHPENGVSPAITLASIIFEIEKINNSFAEKSLTFATTAGYTSGGKAFGTSPGAAEIYLTLRSYSENHLIDLKNEIESAVKEMSSLNNVKSKIEYTEEFFATVNDSMCVSIVKNSAEQRSMRIINMQNHFPWSEDFGRFTAEHKGCFFGIGAGEESPALHNPDYDFPDEIIEPAVKLFSTIIKSANGETA